MHALQVNGAGCKIKDAKQTHKKEVCLFFQFQFISSMSSFVAAHECKGKTKNKPQTHTSFAGKIATLNFESEDIPKLRSNLFKLTQKKNFDIKKDTDSWNAITEKIISNEPFKFFIDLDWKPEQIGGHENLKNELIELVAAFRDYVSQITNQKIDEFYVAARMIYKLHLYFPSVIVNTSTAKAIVQQLEKMFKQNHVGLFHPKVLDSSVYTTGLRMLWNHKGKMGRDTTAERKQAHIKVFGENSYSECYTLVDPSTFQELPIEIDHLEKTSIHTDLPITFELQTTCNAKICATSVKNDGVDYLTLMTEEEVMDLRRFIEDHYKFQPNAIKKMIRIGDSLHVAVQTNWCPFKKGEHSGNIRQRIVMNVTCGVWQKCWSEKLNECRDGKHNFIKFSQLPKSIRKLVTRYTQNIYNDADEAFRSLIPLPVENEEYRKQIDWKITRHKQVDRGVLATMSNNRFCLVCKEIHDEPYNHLLVTPDGQYTMLCDLNPGGQYPNPPIIINGNQLNVIYQNFGTINNITITGEHQVDPNFDEPVQIFDDLQLNELMCRTFSESTATDIGDVFHYVGKNMFGVSWNPKCSEDTWWVWDVGQNVWIKSNSHAEDFMRRTIADLYQQSLNWYTEHTTDAELRKARVKRLLQLKTRLKNADHDILHQAANNFKLDVRNFDNLLDSSKSLLNFNNGIYDLSADTFRPTHALDYVSLSCGYSLPEQKDPMIQQDINAFIESIIPDSDSIRYLWKWMASCLDGYNREEIFTIFNGNGRNGKGVLAELLLSAFGGTESITNGYGHVVQVSLLTEDRPASNKSSVDVCNLKGKRFVITSEPEKDASIKGGFLKLLTGNDMMTGRYNYSNVEVKFAPQHSLVLQCNDIPKMNSEDDAIWDRSRIIDFPFKFVDEPIMPNHRKIDRMLKTRVRSWSPQFMLMLLDWYKVYKAEGLNPPEAVRSKINNVREENEDENLTFMKEYLQTYYDIVKPTKEDKCTISRKDIIEHFDSIFPTAQDKVKNSLLKAAKALGIQETKHLGPTRSLRGYQGLKRKTNI